MATNLTRANLIKQATRTKEYLLPLFIPGVQVNVSASSGIGWRQAVLCRVDRTNWLPISDVITIPESDTKG